MPLRITWIGHSTVLLDTGRVRLLTDPALRARVTHLRRVAPAPDNLIGEVDAALISHLHYDHLDVPSLRRLGPSTRLVVPAGAGRYLAARGLANVTEVEPGGRIDVRGVAVEATEASHAGGRPPRRIAAQALGYVIESGSSRVYFAGDTDVFPGMRGLAPGLDVALLPIWGWGASVGPGHLDPRRAAEALSLLAPRIAIPIHWGTYRPLWHRSRPGSESALLESFRRHAGELAPGVVIRVLGLGDSLDVD